MKVTGICLFARFYWISNPNLPWLWKNDYLRSVLRDQADRWHPSAATFPQNLFQQPHSGKFSSEAVLPKPEPAGEKKEEISFMRLKKSALNSSILARKLLRCFNNSKRSEEDRCSLEKAVVTSGTCDKTWVNY